MIFNSGQIRYTIHSNGYQYWYKDRLFHRLSGYPAIIFHSYQEFYKDGKRIRCLKLV